MNYLVKFLSAIKFFVLITISIFVISCEEVIKIDLNSSSPKFVAEGYIEKDSVSWLKLSYTKDYFTKEKTSFVNDASVYLSDKKGNTEMLDFVGDGLYKGSKIIGVVDAEYTMRIDKEDKSYLARSKLLIPTKIHSVNFEKRDTPHPDLPVRYTSTIIFNDDQTETNYYLLKFWVNDTLDIDGYTCIKDSYFTKNKSVEFSPMRLGFKLNDKVVIYIYSIDKAAYAYFNQLNDILGSGMGSSTPYNAQSNFGSDFLGFFMSMSYDSINTVVK